MNIVKILRVKLRKIADSQGFFISVGHLNDRVANGLEIGKEYDLDITESEAAPDAD